jgi:hypothetical protein
MKMSEAMIQQQVQPIPEEHVQPLPDEATTRQKSRVGEQQPVRLEVGEPQDKGRAENCLLFLGQSWSFSQHRSERQEWRDSCVPASCKTPKFVVETFAIHSSFSHRTPSILSGLSPFLSI